MRRLIWNDPCVSVRVTPVATIVELKGTEYGSLDGPAMEHVARVLQRLADESKPKRLIVDLSRVCFLGARLIGVLISTRLRLKKRSRRLTVCGLQSSSAKLACVMQLNRLFQIVPTQRLALSAAMQDTLHKIGPRAADRVRVAIRISDVAWDRSKMRLDYLTESDVPIYTRIVPRGQPVGMRM